MRLAAESGELHACFDEPSKPQAKVGSGEVMVMIRQSQTHPELARVPNAIDEAKVKARQLIRAGLHDRLP